MGAIHRYANLSGKSGVAAYALEERAIVVAFFSGAIYRYTDQSAGPDAVAAMKARARSGRGLATYISRHVAQRYSERLR